MSNSGNTIPIIDEWIERIEQNTGLSIFHITYNVCHEWFVEKAWFVSNSGRMDETPIDEISQDTMNILEESILEKAEAIKADIEQEQKEQQLERRFVYGGR